LPNDFELFETMHATQAEGCRHLDRHLQRMRTSAMYFGFKFDEAAIRNAVQQECAALQPDSTYRLRLALNQLGICSIKSTPLLPLAEPVKLLLAPQPTVASDLFLRHKTTVRKRYDEAWRAAEAQGAFDMLFCNTQGELTEGGRSNVLIKLDGRWITPPLAAGLLPGVMRAVLLEDPGWNVQERRLTVLDLHAAEEIVVCNALRGVLRAVLN
jgi:para-aminobenzoate synthetase / 4-amino-4-deoxychorismate lyase